MGGCLRPISPTDALTAFLSLNSQERDEKEALEKKKAYEKLHKEGKTDEYKKDMERLAEAKARREAQAAKKKEEEEAAAAQAAMGDEFRNLNVDDDDDDDDDEKVAKLDAREIKKMNPKQVI